MGRVVRLGVLVCLVGVLALRVQTCRSQIEAKRRAAQMAYLGSEEEPSSLPLKPYARRAALADAYRLRPDRRFLLAFGEIARFTGTKAITVMPAFHDGGWTLSATGEELGRVPELPDFGDLSARLQAFARTRLPDVAKGDSLKGTQALQWESTARAQLPKALALWEKTRSREALADAARSAAALSFYAVDLMETGDELPARALALTALAQAAGADVRTEQTILAAALGYGAAARKLAASPGVDPALKAYVLDDGPALSEGARLRGATPAARYLFVRYAMDRGENKAVEEFLGSFHGEERFTVPVVAQQLRRTDDMFEYLAVASCLPVFVIGASEGVAPDPKEVDHMRRAAGELAQRLQLLPSTSWFQRLDDSLAKLGRDDQLYFRALALSALHKQGDFYVEGQSNRDSAEKFSEWLRKDSSPSVRDFQRWFAARVSLMRNSPEQALGEVEASSSIGGAPAIALLESALERTAWAHPRTLRAVRASIGKLDTRISHRTDFGVIAWNYLQDARVTQKLVSSAIEADPGHQRSTEEWFANLAADAGKLLRIAKDPSFPRWVRKRAAQDLRELGGAHADEALQAARNLLNEYPNDWDTLAAVGRLHRLSGRLSEGRDVLVAWLGRHQHQNTLEVANIRGIISYYDYLMGEYAAGWEAARPALASSAEEPMSSAALNLSALHRVEDARRIASNLLERYPDAGGLAIAAEVEWNLGDTAAAAKLFRSPPAPLTLTDFEGSIGESFTRIFRKRTPAAAAEMASQLLSAGVDRGICEGLATALQKENAQEHAFAVREMLSKGVQGGARFYFLLRAAHALEKARGTAAAREWIVSQLPRPMSDFDARQLAIIGFQHGTPQVAWEFAPDPTGNDGVTENFWLFRAAAVAMQGSDAPFERREALRAHYATVKGTSHYDTLARYLIGEVSEAEAAKLVLNNSRACEVPYYFAVKAVGEKRFADASDWYHVAMECGKRDEAEYIFAQGDLYRWRAEKNPFAKLGGAPATAGAPR